MSYIMSTNPYIWLPDNPIQIAHHSVKKHEVLKTYLIYYLEILTQNPHVRELKLTLVDGFAGGGEYIYENDTYLGSPLIMMDAVKEASATINIRRKNQNLPEVKVDTDFFFIEKRKSNYQYLTNFIKKLEYNTSSCQFIQGSFDTYYQSVIDHIKKRRGGEHCIFFLDQSGYSHVTCEATKHILKSLKGAEVILNFSVDFLVDFLKDKNDIGHSILKRIGIAQPGVENIFKILGEKENPNWRRLIQYELRVNLIASIQPNFYTPFFIQSDKSHRAYWLLHFSNHGRARSAITDIHWSMENTFTHYGHEGLDMLGYRSKSDNSFSPQSAFEFDSEARIRSVKSLSESLPRLIYNEHDITFKTLYDKTCNTTPANEAIFKEALEKPLESGDIEIIGLKGEKRRKAKAMTGNDTIRTPSQRRFFF